MSSIWPKKPYKIVYKTFLLLWKWGGGVLLEYWVGISTNIGAAIWKLAANYVAFFENAHLLALMLSFLLQPSTILIAMIFHWYV